MRGLGFLLGLRCVVPNTEMVGRLREAGLLTAGAAENVIRLLPPLIITERQVDQAVAILDRVAADWAKAA